MDFRPVFFAVVRARPVAFLAVDFPPRAADRAPAAAPLVVFRAAEPARLAVLFALDLPDVDLPVVDLRPPVDLRAVDFLRPPVDLRAVDFLRPVDFLAPVDLRAVDFLRPVDFLAPVDLRAADFLRPVDFLAPVDLRAPVDFRAVDFLRPVDSLAPVDLRAVDFLRPPVDFLAPVDLRAVDFLRPVDFFAVDLRPVDLRPVDLRLVDFRPEDLLRPEVRDPADAAEPDGELEELPVEESSPSLGRTTSAPTSATVLTTPPAVSVTFATVSRALSMSPLSSAMPSPFRERSEIQASVYP